MTKQPTWAAVKNKNHATSPQARFRLTSLDRLRAALVAHGFTSGYKLAKATGIGVGTINHIVHGRRKTASAVTVSKLREALGVSVDELFVLDKSTVHDDYERKAA